MDNWYDNKDFFHQTDKWNQKGIKVIIVCWLPARIYVYTNFNAILGIYIYNYVIKTWLSFIIFTAKKLIVKLYGLQGVQSHINMILCNRGC